MQVLVLNLDRHPGRWHRISAALPCTDVLRIAAVDGRALPGPESPKKHRSSGYESLTRYERAVAASHGAAWSAFLETGDAACCVLEDDVCLSPDFAEVMAATNWIPADADVVKIETFAARTYLSHIHTTFRGREISRLRSTHLGAAGYVLTRRGAQALAPQAIRPDLPIDHVLFGEPALSRLRAYQLNPALCIQAIRLSDDAPPDLRSSVQQARPRKLMADRLRAEIGRPFRQAATGLRRMVDGTYMNCDPQVVPFR